MAHLVEPPTAQILDYCAEDPVERVFLEDAARRGLGRFSGLAEDGRLVALCHTGANVVPSGRGCGVFAEATARARGANADRRAGCGDRALGCGAPEAAAPREDRPGQPVYAIDAAPAAGRDRPATRAARRPRPAPAGLRAGARGGARHRPARRDADGFRWRTRAQIEEGRSWLWAEDGVILFKAEASAWTPAAVQLQQVWVDPVARGAGNGDRGLRDLIRLLLERVPRVCLFVRADNQPAIRLYEKVGMEHVLDYRSVLL